LYISETGRRRRRRLQRKASATGRLVRVVSRPVRRRNRSDRAPDFAGDDRGPDERVHPAVAGAQNSVGQTVPIARTAMPRQIDRSKRQ